MSSDVQEVPKMVGIYKKLFLLLTVVTAIGILVSYWHMPIWLAVSLAMVIIVWKSGVVYGSFQHLMGNRMSLLLVFGMTLFFFAGLLLLPLFNHGGFIVGTTDLSKEVQMQQMQQAPKKEHGEGHHGG